MQVIPYKSANESVLAVVGGQVTLTIADAGPVLPQVKSGTVRALAVAACFGLSFAHAMPSRASGYAIHARFCGDPGGQVPSDRKRLPQSPDGPSPCHAVCPRKHAATIGDKEDPYTG